mmetsp:Transcript_27862/g.31987  ORF Transcript_27862/g.31987 Transcript_27862/m.31987 type:complete len:159 (-) Transcript_27862:94-570(-)
MYKGEWKDNNMEGHGVYQWKDGRRYEGQYLEDKKHGYGIYFWADGRKYEGYWAFGKQHGLGRYFIPQDGKEKSGLWEDGKRTEWFEPDVVAKINARSQDYRVYFRNDDSGSHCDEFATFERPPRFMKKVEAVVSKLDDLVARFAADVKRYGILAADAP